MIRQRILFILTLLFPTFLTAQLYIGDSATFHVADSLEISIQDLDWENNGDFHAGKGKFSFSSINYGSEMQIKGSQTNRFHNITLDKGYQSTISMGSDVYVDGVLEMKSGNLDLGSYMLSLGDYPGVITDEREDSYIGGEGMIIKIANLSVPQGATPGNMGIKISSATNMGKTILVRQHHTTWLDGVPSINRQFLVQPENYSQLDGEVTLNYLDAELNGLDEDQLVYWHEKSGKWIKLNPNLKDKLKNQAIISSLDTLGRLTLGIDLETPDAVVLDETVNTRLTTEKVFSMNTFPNPVVDRLLVELSEATKDFMEVCLTDSYGKAIFTKGLLPGTKMFRLDMANIPQGFYVLMINNGESRLAQQVVIKI